MNYFTKMGYFKKSKKYIIPNGINIIVDRIPKEGDVKEFIFLGRLHETKGPQIAVRAFRNLKKQDLKLHIVGEGRYLNSLKRIAGDDRRIIFHGYLSYEKLGKLFDRCGYGIVPSLWYENYGYVIIELMINGLPVIGSRIGGIPETILDGYNGYFNHFTV